MDKTNVALIFAAGLAVAGALGGLLYALDWIGWGAIGVAGFVAFLLSWPIAAWIRSRFFAERPDDPVYRVMKEPTASADKSE